MSYKELSKYYSNSQQKIATVYVDIQSKNYSVSFKDEFGSSFTAMYPSEEEADNAAESYVL
jgi:hypothetical protein